jgi:hypothetical protein
VGWLLALGLVLEVVEQSIVDAEGVERVMDMDTFQDHEGIGLELRDSSWSRDPHRVGFGFGRGHDMRRHECTEAAAVEHKWCSGMASVEVSP